MSKETPTITNFNFGTNPQPNPWQFNSTLNFPPKLPIKKASFSFSDIAKNEDLKQLPFDFDNLKHCDVRLKADGQTFEAHKFVLATQSPFFDKMFSNECKEKNENEVSLDIEADVLKEALRFMYTGEVKKMDEISFGLIRAADFLQMDRLKRMCELSLEKQLTILNCVDLVMLAEKIIALSLKKCAVEYIVNFKSQVERSSLKKLFEEQPALAMELFLSEKKIKEK